MVFRMLFLNGLHVTKEHGHSTSNNNTYTTMTYSHRIKVSFEPNYELGFTFAPQD